MVKFVLIVLNRNKELCIIHSFIKLNNW